MQITTGLLTKGLMGLGAIAGVVTGGVFLFKKGEEPAKVPAVSALPPPPKPTFKENLEKQIPNLVTEDNQLCSKKEDTKYTCDARTKGTELKEKLKFTTDGENELKVKEDLKGQKIELKESEETNIFPNGIMLVLENGNSPITLQEKAGNADIKTFKKKTNPEFKFENGKFKHAWTIKTLGEKVGLDCKEENDQKTCTLKEGKTINVKEEDKSNKQVEGVTFEGSLKYEEEQEGHSQGFKLTVTNDIKLLKDGKEISGSEITKLEGGSTSYDIKLIVASDESGDVIKWYLRKYNENNR